RAWRKNLRFHVSGIPELDHACIASRNGITEQSLRLTFLAIAPVACAITAHGAWLAIECCGTSRGQSMHRRSHFTFRLFILSRVLSLALPCFAQDLTKTSKPEEAGFSSERLARITQ